MQTKYIFKKIMRRSGGEFTNVKQLFKQPFDACVNKSLMKKILSADFLAIATQRLVNAKHQCSQILPCPTQHKGESEQDFTA
jgi:hypothetical protein